MNDDRRLWCVFGPNGYAFCNSIRPAETWAIERFFRVMEETYTIAAWERFKANGYNLREVRIVEITEVPRKPGRKTK